MRSLVFLVALTFALGACAPRPMRAQGASGCLPANSETDFFGDVLTIFLTQADATNTMLREKLNLPQLTANSISLVTDSRTCDKAISALNAAQGQTTSRRLYLFKLGNSRFGVIEQPIPPASDVHGGGSTSVWYFDSKWTYVSTGEL